MKATIENNELVLRLPLQTPAPSSSGKTLVVASTHGFAATTATLNEKVIHVSVNAFIKK
jgi:hypothetical protein